MFENLSLLQLVLMLVACIGVFIFLLSVVLPGKEEKLRRTEGTEKPTYYAKSGEVGEDDRSVIVALLSEKIDELSKRLDKYSHEVKNVEDTIAEHKTKTELNLSKLTQTMEKLTSSIASSSGIGAEEREILNKLNEKVTNLEKKMEKPYAEKTELNEVKNKLEELVTILKTLGS